MKVAKVQDIANLADGSIIGEMKVQVKAAFPPRTGDGKYGPWRVQACILKDATGEVRASFWTNEDMQQSVGKVITIKSQSTNKGLQGLSVQYSKHSDANELKITEKAGIYDGDGPAVQQYVQSHAASAPQNTSKTPHAAAATNPQTARKRLFQQAQLYSECIKAANYIRENHKLTDEHFQAAVASMYISADRAGLFACFPETAGKPEKPPVDEIPMSHEADEFGEEVGW
jgi:hypothetical protein